MKDFSTKNKFPQFLIDEKIEMEKELNKFIELEFDKLKNKWPFVAELLPAIEAYLNREGKRIRPILTKLSYIGLGGSDADKIILPAIGTEFLHASILINDDLYDDMPNIRSTRGGKKVLHDRLFEQFIKNGSPGDSNWEPELFSKHASIAVAHILLAIGLECIQRS